MPYETVQEKVVQTRRVRVCARCRSEMPDNRQTINRVGGVGGSLGASLGGSMILGSVLGPVGAIGGAIAGSIVGARAGQQTANHVADAVDTVKGNNEVLCPACQALVNNGAGQEEGGGHRLESGAPAEARRSSNAQEKVGEAAQAAGRGIQNGLTWMKQSVTNVVDNVKNSNNNNNDTNNSNNPAPAGGGHRLGSGTPISGSQTSGIL